MHFRMQFQSRNRDACHFRTLEEFLRQTSYIGFNLAIEMLVISGENENRPDAIHI